MKWLDNWIAKKCKEAWDNAGQNSTLHKISTSDMKALTLGGYNVGQQVATPSPATQSINFQIYPATGGHVVEIQFLEANTYSINGTIPHKSLHIIPSTEDLGAAISKIITLEMLKR